MKNTLISVIVIVVVAIAGYFILKDRSDDSSDSESKNGSAKGTVVVSFTDETAAIKNVSEVTMRVDKVELYSETNGWVKAGGSNVEYKLLELKAKGESKVYATAEIAADTYTRAKITVKKVAVKTKTEGEKTATMPREEIDMASRVVVRGEKTASVNFDVLADESLHTTSKGEFVFTPVVRTESRSDATVTISSEDTVTVTGGALEDNTVSGMDIDGSVKAGFRINADAKIDISGGSLNFLNRTDGAATTSVIIKGVLDASVDRDAGGAVEGTVDGVIRY